MEGLTAEALKALLFIVPGLVSLRVKSALAISSPSSPYNTTVDGLILTLLDHASYGVMV